MKLLFDENLSRRSVAAVQEFFPGSAHASQVGLISGTSDLQIWAYAKQHDFAIVTADTDFVTLANTFGPPPKVILLENCDYPTSVAARLIASNEVRLSEFGLDHNALLILRQQ
ncbi:MAG: DUF5615 family PIN-like protein [Candidatus Acidiferrum sp.]